MAAVTSTSSRAGTGLAAAVAGSRSARGALTVLGAAKSTRGEAVKNHTVVMTIAVTTLANIRPNALRIVTLPQKPAPSSRAKPLMREGLNAVPTQPCSSTKLPSPALGGRRFDSGCVTDIIVCLAG